MDRTVRSADMVHGCYHLAAVAVEMLRTPGTSSGGGINQGKDARSKLAFGFSEPSWLTFHGKTLSFRVINAAELIISTS